MSVQYDHSGDQIISCGHDRRVVVTTAGGDLVTEIRNCPAEKLMAAFVVWPEDKLIVVGSGGGAVYSLPHPTKPLFQVRHGSDWILSAASPSRGNTFITCGYDNTARAWSLHNGEFLGIVANHPDRVVCCIMLDDTYFLTGSNDKTVRLWNLASQGVNPTPVRSFEAHTNFVNTLATGPRQSSSCLANMFVSGGYDGMLASWDIRMKRPIAQVKSAIPGTVGSATIHSDAVFWSCGTTVNCSSLFDLRQRWTRPSAQEGSSQIWSIAVHPEGRSFLTACNAGVVKQWCLASMEPPT
jgi:WD40 repeat protein